MATLKQLKERYLKILELMMEEYPDNASYEYYYDSYSDPDYKNILPLSSFLVDILHSKEFQLTNETLHRHLKIERDEYEERIYDYVSDNDPDVDIEIVSRRLRKDDELYNHEDVVISQSKKRYWVTYTLYLDTGGDEYYEEFSTNSEYEICRYIIYRDRLYDKLEKLRMDLHTGIEYRKKNVILRTNENFDEFNLLVKNKDGKYVRIAKSEDVEKVIPYIEAIKWSDSWKLTLEKMKKNNIFKDVLSKKKK